METTQTNAYPYPFVTDDVISREADRLAREVCNRRPHSAAEDEDDEHMALARDGATTGLKDGFRDMSNGVWVHNEAAENRYWPSGWDRGYRRARELVAAWLYDDLLVACTKIVCSDAMQNTRPAWLRPCVDAASAAIAKARGK